MLTILKQIPIVKALIPLIAGVTLVINTEYRFPHLNIVIIGLITGLLLFKWVLPAGQRYRYNWLPGIWLPVIFFFIGIFLIHHHTDKNHSRYYGHFIDKTSHWSIQVLEPPVEKKKSVKILASIDYKLGEDSLPVIGKCLFYFKKSPQSLNIKYGDRLIVSNTVRNLKPPSNPDEFNYAKYLSFHNINHQGYLKEGEWSLSGRNRGSRILASIYGLRSEMLLLIQKHLDSEDSRAVANALLLGYKENLDSEIKSFYASTGAMHVLAVSGLHVGIIYLVFSGFLGIVFRFRQVKYVKPILLLCLIWAYAILTGLSPSVIRACTMFSFIIIGGSLNKPINIYSSICGSAFLLLIIDPYLITETGFLLSYFAVLGIVYLQPKLYKLIYFRRWLPDRIWAITCVSISAQLATFPISILFFHQFPTYFLVSNLIVIPAAVLILYSGILLFTFSWIPGLVEWIGIWLNFLINALNTAIRWMGSLPYTTISPLTVDIPSTLLIYSLIISLLWFSEVKKPAVLYWSLGITILLVCLFNWQWLQNQRHSEWIVYNVPKSTAINLISNKKSILITDSLLMANPSSQLFHINHHWWAKGIKMNQNINLSGTGDGILIEINEELLIIPNQSKIPEKVLAETDYLILTAQSNPTWSIKNGTSKKALILLDCSMGWKAKNKAKKLCIKFGLTYYDVMNSEAFIKSIE